MDFLQEYWGGISTTAQYEEDEWLDIAYYYLSPIQYDYEEE